MRTLLRGIAQHLFRARALEAQPTNNPFQLGANPPTVSRWSMSLSLVEAWQV